MPLWQQFKPSNMEYLMRVFFSFKAASTTSTVKVTDETGKVRFLFDTFKENVDHEFEFEFNGQLDMDADNGTFRVKVDPEPFYPDAMGDVDAERTAFTARTGRTPEEWLRDWREDRLVRNAENYSLAVLADFLSAAMDDTMEIAHQERELTLQVGDPWPASMYNRMVFMHRMGTWPGPRDRIIQDDTELLLVKNVVKASMANLKELQWIYDQNPEESQAVKEVLGLAPKTDATAQWLATQFGGDPAAYMPTYEPCNCPQCQQADEALAEFADAMKPSQSLLTPPPSAEIEKAKKLLSTLGDSPSGDAIEALFKDLGISVIRIPVSKNNNNTTH